MNSEGYLTCEGCGIVMDTNAICMDTSYEYKYNHGQDKKCKHFQCPVCQTWTPNEEWEEI